MKMILVTGGAGFLGSHLCDRLIARGDEVLCVDNFFTGHRRNVEHLLQHPRFELMRHDIVHPLFLEVDQIYNLACPASPIHYQFNPIKTIKCSTVGMVNMLGLARRTKARILQASTSEVYGDPEVHPQREDYWGHVNPIGSRSCYDEGKRVAEALCMDYHRQNMVDIRIVRIFNTYGPRMRVEDGRAIPAFLSQALRDQDVTVFGDGSQTRSLCFVSDLVDGIFRLMTSGESDPVNIGNPQEMTIRDLAERIIALTGSRSRIVYRPLPVDDPRVRQPDIGRARAKLGWEPKVSLEQGLAVTIDYFRRRLGV
jgi:UDP-glucuronate decarboxylase